MADLLDPKSAARARLRQIAAGSSNKVDLAGGAYAVEQVYMTKARADGLFEAHRKYIDVQVVVEGEEIIEVEDVTRLPAKTEYNDEKDYLLFNDSGVSTRLIMRPGDAAVLFPADGHMPCVQLKGSLLVRKTVVKVPVA
ncbi:MAG: YhcH/YjgK/YiaL family protein [Opitutaceae bacterium]|nr:YhcH/YjgK/YiaL family protein [Opitutaceae bacterium]